MKPIRAIIVGQGYMRLPLTMQAVEAGGPSRRFRCRLDHMPQVEAHSSRILHGRPRVPGGVNVENL